MRNGIKMDRSEVVITIRLLRTNLNNRMLKVSLIIGRQRILQTAVPANVTLLLKHDTRHVDGINSYWFQAFEGASYRRGGATMIITLRPSYRHHVEKLLEHISKQ